MSFGRFVRIKRKKNKLKLTELADSIRISSSYLSSIENGVRYPPSFELQQKIADALNLNNEDRYKLYDLAAESKKTRSLADDLNEYILQIPNLRVLLRASKEHKLTPEDWEEIYDHIKTNYFV